MAIEISPLLSQNIASQYSDSASKTKPAASKNEKSVAPVTGSTAAPKMDGAGSTKMAFHVNSKNNEVVILVQDKATSKVLRTIPAEAIKDLPSGDLLNVSA